jgi:hypothetical protein
MRIGFEEALYINGTRLRRAVDDDPWIAFYVFFDSTKASISGFMNLSSSSEQSAT